MSKNVAKAFTQGALVALQAARLSLNGACSRPVHVEHFPQTGGFDSHSTNNHVLPQLCTKNTRSLHPLNRECRTGLRYAPNDLQECAAITPFHHHSARVPVVHIRGKHSDASKTRRR
jgi:hypothetical protein